MQRPNRDISVFSTSAVDLFASALGAFILLVMLLFPFYRNAGDASAYSRTLDVMEQRDLAAGDLRELQERERALQSELERIAALNRTEAARVARMREQVERLQARLAEQPTPAVEPAAEPEPEPDTPAPVASQEFSILGIATAAKSFVIVIDMSGSMLPYTDLMIRSVLEVLEPLDGSNRVAVVGYQGDPSPVLWPYPDRTTLLPATQPNLRAIRDFITGLARNFAGSTPTHAAVLAALEYQPDAVILMSDGAPDTNPNFIVQDITQRNRFSGVEIHTVAIGDYTQDRALVTFLQALAQSNDGNFVGVSR